MIFWKEPMEIYFDEKEYAEYTKRNRVLQNTAGKRDVELVNDPELQDLIAVKITMEKCLRGETTDEPAIFLFDRHGSLVSNSILPDGLKFIKLRNKDFGKRYSVRVRSKLGWKDLTASGLTRLAAAEKLLRLLSEEEMTQLIDEQMAEVE